MAERNGFKKLYIEQEMKSGEILPVSGGVVGIYSTKSPDNETNEDTAAVLSLPDGSTIIAVADGVGGARCGEDAARIAVEVLIKSLLKEADQGGDTRLAILDGFELANRAIIDLGVGAYTTLAVVQISTAAMRCYHAGDSRVLALSRRGKVKFQSMLHCPVGYALEAGLMEEDEANDHPDRYAVSNLLGAPDMRVELSSMPELKRHDTVLVASDGLLDNLSTDEVAEILKNGELSEAVDSLAGQTLQRMLTPPVDSPSKPDDLTFVVFRLAE